MKKTLLILLFYPLITFGQCRLFCNMNGNSNDLSGNGYNGTDHTITYTPVKYNQAASFGSSSYIQFAQDGTGKFDYQSFTISFWVQTPASWGGVADYRILWSFDKTSHTPPYYSQHIRFTTGNTNEAGFIMFGWNNGTVQYIASTSAISNSAIHNIIVVYTSGRQEIWDNGHIVASGTVTGTIGYYAQYVWAGKANFANTQPIVIDEIKFWSFAFSPAQCKNEYMKYILPQ